MDKALTELLNRASLTPAQCKQWASRSSFDGLPSEQKRQVDPGRKSQEWLLDEGDQAVVVWMPGPVVQNDELVVVVEKVTGFDDMFKVKAVDDGYECFKTRLSLLKVHSWTTGFAECDGWPKAYDGKSITIRTRAESIVYYEELRAKRQSMISLCQAIESYAKLTGQQLV